MAESNGNHPLRQRRSRVPDKPNKSVNLWSVMKNSVGKDNMKLPCPVNFMEPLSFLQGGLFKAVVLRFSQRWKTCPFQSL